MKRFYKTAAAVAEGGKFHIALDGKRVRTPLGASLAVRSQALAEAIAAEWMAQAEIIQPTQMPLTAIANTGIDRVVLDRKAAVAQLMRYAETDLLCYRAEEPAELVARQTKQWQPVIDWAAAEHGARLAVSAGVVPFTQPAEAITALERALASHDDLALAALANAVTATGSLLLGLALAQGRLSAEETFAAAQLDETFQNEQWGEVEEAAPRREGLRREIEAAATVLRLLRAG